MTAILCCNPGYFLAMMIEISLVFGLAYSAHRLDDAVKYTTNKEILNRP